MAGTKLILFCTLLGLVLTVSSQKPQGGQECPPENPFCPVWVPCNYTEIQGPTCQDCSTRVICTAVGGLVRPCVWPGRPHCVAGQCSAEPSAECSPATTEASETTAAATETTAAATETTAAATETTAAATETTAAPTKTTASATVAP